MKKEELEKIANKVRNCKKCELYKSRNKVVPGGGNLGANLVFMGEAPGRQEDLRGKPFVGRTGEILDELLNSIGIERKDVFITNILKCRPPSNRDPRKAEIEACSPYLDRQLEIIKPGVIAPLGRFATSYILRYYKLGPEKISKVHGKIFNTLK